MHREREAMEQKMQDGGSDEITPSVWILQAAALQRAVTLLFKLQAETF